MQVPRYIFKEENLRTWVGIGDVARFLLKSWDFIFGQMLWVQKFHLHYSRNLPKVYSGIHIWQCTFEIKVTKTQPIISIKIKINLVAVWLPWIPCKLFKTWADFLIWVRVHFGKISWVVLWKSNLKTTLCFINREISPNITYCHWNAAVCIKYYVNKKITLGKPL